MPDTFASIRDFAVAIRPADIVDVAIVAVVAHVILRWAQRAHSRFVFAGLAAILVTYLVARWLDLRLTLFLFQVLITVALVALVVIFQDDLRRGFERLGQRSLRERPAPGDHSRLTDVVSSAAGTLADRHVGALIVIRGLDPLSRHLSGGVRLDGAPSEPLLLSIFDPASAGHDGAVILDGNRIARFGVHLPLSHRVPGGRKLGTRHAAALGLSERTDALVVAVSEERGVISVVEDGAIAEMPDTSALRERLDRFFEERREPVRGTLARRIFVQGLGLKLAALVVAIAGFIVVYGLEREQMVRSYTVPVALADLPEGWMVQNHEPAQARITVTGATRAFDDLNPSSLVASLSLKALHDGFQQRPLTPSLVDVPRPLRVVSIEPGWVRFEAFRTETVTAAVEPSTTGALPDGISLASIRTEPDTVQILVRAGAAVGPQKVRTLPVDMTTIRGPTRIETQLDAPRGTWLAPGQPTEVTVVVDVEGGS